MKTKTGDDYPVSGIM